MTSREPDRMSLIKWGEAIRIERKVSLYTAAIACFRRAIQLKPDSVPAHHKLSQIYKLLGRNEDAKRTIQAALELNPGFIRGYFTLLDILCPIVYENEEDIACYRSAYTRQLEELCETIDLTDSETVKKAAKAVGKYPFHLAYQGFNDLYIQKKYGNLVCRIQAARYPQFTRPVATPIISKGEPLRVGIVSGFFHFHSAFKYPVKGWLEAMDKTKFKIFGYYTGTKQDTCTDMARNACARFVEGDLSVESLAEKILSDKLHALIYPEIGMNGLTIRLSSLRLAPVQCVAWGHTTTSGLPTMDYYLSSNLMEPPDAENHYSEKLVRMPNLSFYHTPSDMMACTMKRSDLGLKDNTVVYLCLQSLFKYLPSYDHVLARIAKRVGSCQFVFVTGNMSKQIVNILKNRLKVAFLNHGLNSFDHTVFLPYLENDSYFSLHHLGDVFLDSMGWSGCNTTMDALTYHLPVVTFPGILMRGRQTMGILKMMDVTETIANSVDYYVEIAVRLGKDQVWRQQIRDRITSNLHKLYADRTCIDYLQTFLEKTVAESRRI